MGGLKAALNAPIGNWLFVLIIIIGISVTYGFVLSVWIQRKKNKELSIREYIDDFNERNQVKNDS